MTTISRTSSWTPATSGSSPSNTQSILLSNGSRAAAVVVMSGRTYTIHKVIVYLALHT